MPETTDISKELAALIDSSNYTEKECRKYLKFAKELLVPQAVEEFVYVEEEYRGSSGDSDYIISCKLRDETGVETIRAFIWEIKAPQCYIFEKETEQRISPSRSLFQAENQLFNYYHENKGSDRFRDAFKITHPDYVYFGGIIIGRKDRRISGDFDDAKKNQLFEEALRIRKKYIYDPLNIKILYWNFILDFLTPSQPPKMRRGELGTVKSPPLDQSRIGMGSFYSGEATCPLCGKKFITMKMRDGQRTYAFGECPECGFNP